MFTAIFTGGFADNQIALERAAALHYQGQSFELEVPMPAGTMDRAALAALEEQPAIPSACGEPRPGVCFKLAEGRIDLRRVDRTDQYLSRSCEVISDVYRRLAAGSGFRPIVDWRQVRFAFVALVGVASGALIDGTRPRKSGSHRTPRWREMDSNFGSRTRHQAVRPRRGRFPVIGSSPHWPGGTRDFEPPAPSKVDLCARTRTVSGT